MKLIAGLVQSEGGAQTKKILFAREVSGKQMLLGTGDDGGTTGSTGYCPVGQHLRGEIAFWYGSSTPVWLWIDGIQIAGGSPTIYAPWSGWTEANPLTSGNWNIWTQSTGGEPTLVVEAIENSEMATMEIKNASNAVLATIPLSCV